ncbi:hypothetical protein [Aliarcobacter vitoriensis]|uniref:Uncharacterized protein n=1 Tax=Aliarcobacter vitoriensis TaxID=2011099 RepID=A0A366MRF6_9BACT|nr:hypothetical protein [Aliarcobacter vitoriensis]RBQ28835.1 hypothetical protein CRU91_07525 [Aliarcobacter vitoriensis]
MNDSKRVSQRELGRLTNCVHQNISKLVQKGILEVGKDRKLDLNSSLQLLKDFNYLDENNQFRKPTVPRDEKGKEIYTSPIPLSVEDKKQKAIKLNMEIEALKNQINIKEQQLSNDDTDMITQAEYIANNLKEFNDLLLARIKALKEFWSMLSDELKEDLKELSNIEKQIFEKQKQVIKEISKSFLELPKGLSECISDDEYNKDDIIEIYEFEIKFILKEHLSKVGFKFND